MERRCRETSSDVARSDLEEYMVEQPCPACAGRRLKPEAWRCWSPARASARSSTSRSTGGRRSSRASRSGRPAGAVDPDIAGPILKEVSERLRFLRDVGLEYLTLGRAAGSLSGGEAQRIRLATQIGSRLVGVLYILDEPSIGLHQRDNERLLDTLRGLRDLGNTVWSWSTTRTPSARPTTSSTSGPGAGRFGGEVVAEGTVDEILAHPDVADRAVPPARAAHPGAVGAPRGALPASDSAGRRARQQPARPRRGHPARAASWR